MAKKLVEVKHIQGGRVGIVFADGFVDEVDLLVAADGIRSVRHRGLSRHKIPYAERLT